MSNRRKIHDKGRIEGAWTPLRHEPMNSKAWKHMSMGARLLYIALLRRLSFTNYNNGHVYLSTRKAAEELGCGKRAVINWYRELQHYGFLELISPGILGAKGKAAHWRITDMGWGSLDGAPVKATKEYSEWDGELFDRISKTVLKVSQGVQGGAPRGTVKVHQGNHPVPEVVHQGVHREAPAKVHQGVHTKSHHLPMAESHKSEAARSNGAAAALPGLRVWTTPVLTEIEYTPELRKLYCEAVSLPGIGHNAGPPLLLDEDDLSIPTFLRRLRV